MRLRLPWRPRRCSTHDRASALVTAQLEVDTGTNPNALTELYASALTLTEMYSNPNVIDCGKPWCRRRREQQR